MNKKPFFKPYILYQITLLILFLSYQVLGADCYTTANDTWSCGTPGSTDNLIITHIVTIDGNFTTIGDITIRDGGSLSITGNLTASNNTITVEDGSLNIGGNIVLNNQCSFNIYGYFETESSLTVHSGAAFYLKGSGIVDGNLNIDAGSDFRLKSGSDLWVQNDFTNNSNVTEVDGILTIDQGLTNNNNITGVGEISFGSCSGTGMINGTSSTVYCSSSPIDMFSSHCSASDVEPPKFTSFPTNTIDYAVDSDCGAYVSWTVPEVSDNCSIDELTSTDRPGDFFSVGITNVTYTVFDKAGNDAQQIFTITVSDTISPVISGLPNLISIDAELSTCGANVSWAAPNATDNCSAVLSSNYSPGDFFPIGTFTVTYTATDPSGNKSSSSFNVEVTNPHVPVFTNCPTDMVVYVEESNCEMSISWEEPTVEGCEYTLTQSHISGDFFSAGLHEIEYTATSNTTDGVSVAICKFSIEVLDTIPPVFSFCPTTYKTISIDTLNEQSIISWDEPFAKDQCSDVTLKASHQPGDTFDFGVTTITYSAMDAYGNEGICTFDVQAGINNPPEVESQTQSIKAGESIEICLGASDPDGDQVSIHSILSNESDALISEVDSAALCFMYTASSSFSGTDTLQVMIVDDGIPTMFAGTEVIIKVEREYLILPTSAITPNGDAMNDTWIIKSIEEFPNNSVRIFDRWGGLIYQATAYDNISRVWDGKNEGGRFVSEGTYFFVIELGEGDDKITGPIEVIE